MSYIVNRKTFTGPDAYAKANAYANAIWAKSGVFVAIEIVAVLKKAA